MLLSQLGRRGEWCGDTPQREALARAILLKCCCNAHQHGRRVVFPNPCNTYVVRGVLAGVAHNTVRLSLSDTNITNNVAISTVTLLGTCADPFGNTSTIACPTGHAWVGPSNKTISSPSVYAAQCCVSVVAAAGVLILPNSFLAPK